MLERGKKILKSITCKCPAKINLCLDVTGKRSDGYHDLKMIMQSINLFDIVTVEISSGDDIEIYTDKMNIPCDEKNTCYKAAKTFYDKLSVKRNVKIIIEKNIPSGAGMGGGSSDAAGVLRALNKLEGEPFSVDVLKVLGKSVGADVPFCVEGGCFLCEGIGEILTPLEPMKNVYAVVTKPDFSVSTVWVYKNLKIEEISHPDVDKLIEGMEKGDYKPFRKYSGNVLESVIIKEHPEIEDMKKKMTEFGAVYSLMTGSGPTVFGIFEKREDAGNAEKYFKNLNDETYLVSM